MTSKHDFTTVSVDETFVTWHDATRFITQHPRKDLKMVCTYADEEFAIYKVGSPDVTSAHEREAQRNFDDLVELCNFERLVERCA